MSWERSPKGFRVSVRLPAGTEARVVLPAADAASLPTASLPNAGRPDGSLSNGFVLDEKRNVVTGSVRGDWEFSSDDGGHRNGH